MEIDTNFPKGYEPFDRLEVCSNVILGGGSILGVNGFAPVLIGKGKHRPNIWLYMSVQKTWLLLVRRNVSLNPEIRVLNITPNEVTVRWRNIVILHCRWNNEESCSVLKIDLRPLAIDIWGSGDSLFVKNNKFSGNFFQNGKFLIGTGI